MRQLLIVKSPTSFATPASPIDNGLTSHGIYDLSGLKEGAITFFELGSNTSSYNSAPTKNFAIALGRKNGQRNFIIPEVDVNTLRVTKALPVKGNPFSVTFTMPTTVVGSEYTLRFFKKGTVPHERNSWTVSIVAKTTTAATEAAAFIKAVNDRTNDKFNLHATLSTATITIEGNDFEDWNVVAYDALAGTSLTITSAKKAIGDKAYVQNLASFCAAGKGFEHTSSEGREFIPGYPEDVEDLTPTSATPGSSTSGYVIYTLRFKVGRDASKTRDERVWQNVYIAIPVDGNSTHNQITNMDKILPVGDYMSRLEARVTTLED